MKKIIILFCACFCFAQAGYAEKFSADLVTTAHGQTYTGKYYFSNNKMRTDSKVMGVSTSAIILPDQKMMYTLMHDQKMYMAVPLDQAGNAPGSVSHTQLKANMRFIKDETVNGIPVKKYVSVDPQSKQQAYLWLAKDNNLPVKIDIPSAGTVMEYKNITTNFPESVFDPPSGYNKFSMPNFGNFFPK